MEGAKKQSRVDYRMGPWGWMDECVCDGNDRPQAGRMAHWSLPHTRG